MGIDAQVQHSGGQCRFDPESFLVQDHAQRRGVGLREYHSEQ
jgi:hypothetical protein